MRTLCEVIMSSDQKPMEIAKLQRLPGGKKANATIKGAEERHSNDDREMLRGTV